MYCEIDGIIKLLNYCEIDGIIKLLNYCEIDGIIKFSKALFELVTQCK